MDTKKSPESNNTSISTIRSTPQLCVGGCGFYGSSDTDNRCSACHKIYVSTMKVETKSISNESTPKETLVVRKKQKNRKRCFECRKKVGFMGTECRCGYVFCGEHRYADAHSCDFDYKELNRRILKENNTDAKFSKLENKL